MRVLIVKDAAVEDAGFQHTMKVVPSHRHFSNTELYEETRRQTVKDLCDPASVALTADGWSSRATERFLTVTARYFHSGR
ncbi:hypothetical protein JOB18_027896 [Solea senegalensis]|uniref:Uncharacterized protein n=1 Tax=Solea senegalensis TaxID=28829 RepID=A0AAV6R1N2_SOLSE|nr:hypothetical protein JOB18_027896 [Solea senegalensis]